MTDLLWDHLGWLGTFPALGVTLGALQRIFFAFLDAALRPALRHNVQARVKQDLMEHFIGNTACKKQSQKRSWVIHTGKVMDLCLESSTQETDLGFWGAAGRASRPAGCGVSAPRWTFWLCRRGQRKPAQPPGTSLTHRSLPTQSTHSETETRHITLDDHKEYAKHMALEFHITCASSEALSSSEENDNKCLYTFLKTFTSSFISSFMEKSRGSMSVNSHSHTASTQAGESTHMHTNKERLFLSTSGFDYLL